MCAKSTSTGAGPTTGPHCENWRGLRSETLLETRSTEVSSACLSSAPARSSNSTSLCLVATCTPRQCIAASDLATIPSIYPGVVDILPASEAGMAGLLAAFTEIPAAETLRRDLSTRRGSTQGTSDTASSVAWMGPPHRLLPNMQ